MIASHSYNCGTLSPIAAMLLKENVESTASSNASGNLEESFSSFYYNCEDLYPPVKKSLESTGKAIKHAPVATRDETLKRQLVRRIFRDKTNVSNTLIDTSFQKFTPDQVKKMSEKAMFIALKNEFTLSQEEV